MSQLVEGLYGVCIWVIKRNPPYTSVPKSWQEQLGLIRLDWSRVCPSSLCLLALRCLAAGPVLCVQVLRWIDRPLPSWPASSAGKSFKGVCSPIDYIHQLCTAVPLFCCQMAAVHWILWGGSSTGKLKSLSLFAALLQSNFGILSIWLPICNSLLSWQ